MNKHITRDEFENRFPMVKIFEVDSLCYAYDAKSGMLAEITQDEINQIYNHVLGFNKDGITSYLKGLFRDGVFLPGPLNRVTPEQAELDKIIETQLETVIPRTLMLEVTENCNLNCRYCFFAKKDGFNSRKHSVREMSEIVAYHAIDYYFHRYINAVKKVPDESKSKVLKQNPPTLQWWGGEPFTAFDLIRKTKMYFESLDWLSYGISKQDIVYGLTSNLTIFNDDILSFIVQNSVKLRVSLDGDEEAHNRNRTFPNRKGSFSVVMKNLSTIIHEYPDYAKYNVGIQSVLADNIDVYRSQKFIKEYFKLDTAAKELVMCSTSPQRKENTFLSELEITDTTIEGAMSLFKNEMDIIVSKQLGEIEQLFSENNKVYTNLKKIISTEELLNLEAPKGEICISKMFSCPIGSDTIFVSVDGNFHCCSKTDYSFPFGNIETGIDKALLKSLYIDYHQAIEKQCRSCWALNFCNICPALAKYEEKILLPQERECDQIRKNVLLKLGQYVILTEKYEQLYSLINTLSRSS